ncbi:hypothetical protein BDR07DRAFT_1490102 [Suillus spraguei]|nr:hypothetical protein BDR07DRAFT_1490102 [Suillus spraguei]
MIFGHIKFSGKDIPISPAEERWRLLITDAWQDAQSIEWNDYVDRIPAFVTATKLNWTASDNRKWFTDLAPMVHATLARLQEPNRQATLMDGGVAQDTIDAALSSMQDLEDDLHRINEDETLDASFKECIQILKRVQPMEDVTKDVHSALNIAFLHQSPLALKVPYSSTIMRFAALVALVVVASTVPGLAAPAPIPHPEVTTKREDITDFYRPISDRSRLLPEVVQDTIKRQAPSVHEDLTVFDASSSNAKRQAPSVHEDLTILDASSSNAKRQFNGGTSGGQDY